MRAKMKRKRHFALALPFAYSCFLRFRVLTLVQRHAELSLHTHFEWFTYSWKSSFFHCCPRITFQVHVFKKCVSSFDIKKSMTHFSPKPRKGEKFHHQAPNTSWINVMELSHLVDFSTRSLH